MKTLRVVTVLASLLLMSGCTTARAIQETPSPTFSSAGKEVITETKKAAKTIQEDAIKASEKASEEMAKKDDADQEKETSSESKSNPEPSKTSGSQGTPKSDPVPQKQSVPDPTPVPEPKQDPKPEPTPTPEPEPAPTPEPTPPPAPPQACPGGKDPSVGCDVILDTNYYRETFSSYSEAMSKGQYYMDEVMYIGDIEITSYSVQEVYRNDHSIAYYGLNLWSSGSLIQ